MALRKTMSIWLLNTTSGGDTKIPDRHHDRLTLLGIALDGSFNQKLLTALQNDRDKLALNTRPVLKRRPSYTLRPYLPLADNFVSRKATPVWSYEIICNYMFRNYLKIAWRNLIKNKAQVPVQYKDYPRWHMLDGYVYWFMDME